MAGTTTPDPEALGAITADKVEDAGKVNLEARPSRGSVVGSPEEVVVIGERKKLSPGDAVTAYLELIDAGTASLAETNLARGDLAASVGYKGPPGRPAPDHENDNLPPSRLDREGESRPRSAAAIQTRRGEARRS